MLAHNIIIIIIIIIITIIITIIIVIIIIIIINLTYIALFIEIQQRNKQQINLKKDIIIKKKW